MRERDQLIASVSNEPQSILDEEIPLKKYALLNLSVDNNALIGLDITNPEICQAYIDQFLQKNNAQVAYGGYLEKRNLYQNNNHFSTVSTTPRNIHLGIDFWAAAGTVVTTPLDGKIHSFRNNNTSGNYGPTLILEHKIKDTFLYSLYGHLSLESIERLYIGKLFRRGEPLATLGTSDINVNYAPHLHFQLIWDLQGYQGDYPGVCALEDLDFYRKNCPNPNILLNM